MLIFLLKASFIIAIGLLFYKIVLQQESLFAANRYYLLLCLALALALPHTRLPQLVEQQGLLSNLFMQEHSFTNKSRQSEPLAEFSSRSEAESPVILSQKVDEEGQLSTFDAEVHTTEKGWSYWIFRLYLFGVIIFSLNFLFQIANLIWKIIKSHDKIRDGKFVIVNTAEKQAPCSFFHYIFIHPDDYDFETYEQIIAHEKIHASLWHSLDLLISELSIIFLWFNPLVWLLRKEVEKNIEYQTDALLLESGTVEREAYQMKLVNIAVPHKPLHMTTNYNQSLLKQRIQMMNAKKSTIHSYWKYTFLFPVFFAVVLLLNEPANGQSLTLFFSADSGHSESGRSLDKEKATHMTSLEPKQTHNSWTATIDGKDVCFHFITAYQEHAERKVHWSSTNCFEKSQLEGFSGKGEETFSLGREAGKMTFKGKFEQGEGLGTFSFVPSESYISKLKKEGYSDYSNHELVQFFYADLTIADVKALQTKGYKPDHDELLQLAIFRIDENELEQLLASLQTLGIRKPVLEELIQFKIHNIDQAYIQELQKAGYKDMDLDDIVAAKIHGVDAAYIREMEKAGFSDLSLEEIAQMAVHNIDPQFVKELRDLGYKDLDAEEVVQAKIFNITPEKIQEYKAMNLPVDDIEEVAQYGIHNVNAELMEALKAAGFTNLSADDYVTASVHRITPEFIREYQQMGFNDLDFDDLVSFRVHRITPEFIAALKDAGYTNLDEDDCITAAVHRITPEYIEEYKKMGFKDMDFDRLVEFKIHRITPEFMEGLKEVGYGDLSEDEYVQAAVHRITPSFIKQYQDLGFTDLPFEKLVEMKIHNISPEFLRKHYKKEMAK